MSAPTWSGAIINGGNNRSYIVIDGGTNGIIEATDNGSPGKYTYQNAIRAIDFAGTNNHDIEVKNLLIRNLYDRSSTTDYNTNAYGSSGIYMKGTGNFSVHNNVFQKIGWITTMHYCGTSSNFSFYNNTASGFHTGIWSSDVCARATDSLTGWYFHDNVMNYTRMYDQEDDVDRFHADIFHTAGDGGSGSGFAHITNVQVYNNYLGDQTPRGIRGGGSWARATSYVYLTDDVDDIFVYNNVFRVKPGEAGTTNGMLALIQRSDNIKVYNNLFYGASPTWGITVGAGNTVTNFEAKNNIVLDLRNVWYLDTSLANSDYNLFGPNTNYSYLDSGAHSLFGKDPSLDSVLHLQSGSPAINAGANLSAYCSSMIGLCRDKGGNPRPTTGAWDIGAYEYQSGGNPPPQTPTCTSFTYSAWSTCANGSQSRAVVSSSPSGCAGGSPILTQSCVLSPDTTAPAVSITAPTSGSTVSGSVNIAASASDQAVSGQTTSGITGVQWKLDGANLGQELTTPTTGTTYSGAWNTAGVADGAHTLAAVARDGAGNRATSTISLAVANPVNHAPLLAPTGPKSISENALLSFLISATDSDGDTLTYAVSNLPAGASFNSATRVFSWTPSYIQSGSHTVTFSVSDSKGLSDSEAVIITVANVNRAPLVSAGNDQIINQTVAFPSVISLSGSGSDPDGQTVVYQWSKISGAGEVVFANATAALTTASFSSAGAYVLRLTVSDGSLSAAGEVVITINAGSVAVADSDHDGVADVSDKCPATPSASASRVNALGCPKPKAGKFSSQTDLTNVDLNNVSSYDLGNSFGKISYLETASSYALLRDSSELDLDSAITIEQNRIELLPNLLPELNKPAVLTFYNIAFTEPKILKDGIACPACAITSYANNTLSVTVSGFSVYEAAEGYIPPPPPPQGGGGSASGSGQILTVGTFTPAVEQKPLIETLASSTPAIALASATTTITSYAITNLGLFNRLKGRIILKVQDKGQAYYLHFEEKKMYYLGRPHDAFAIMKSQALGITNANLAKIPVGLSAIAGQDADQDGLADALEQALGTDPKKTDTDGDGHSDQAEVASGYSPLDKAEKLIFDRGLTSRLSGRILLQVEGYGQAWYLNPLDQKRYFLSRPADAFNLMRQLGLGVSNQDYGRLGGK